MARIRTIKPALFTSGTASAWPDDVFRTFCGLLCHVDDDGRAEDDARLVKAEVWPRVDRVTPTKIEKHLALLVADDSLCRYEGDDGRKYMHLVNFSSHQRINRKTDSKLPPCPKHDEHRLFT
jgi:hypothetical protein